MCVCTICIRAHLLCVLRRNVRGNDLEDCVHVHSFAVGRGAEGGEPLFKTSLLFVELRKTADFQC